MEISWPPLVLLLAVSLMVGTSVYSRMYRDDGVDIEEENNLIQATAQFAQQYYDNSIISSKQDAVSCPLGIHLMLGLTVDASEEGTGKPMKKLLGLEKSHNLAKGYASLHDKLQETAHLDFESYTAYTDAALFNANPLIDRDTNPEEAVKILNQWAANNTKEEIKDFIAPGSIKENTTNLVLHAMNLTGEWVDGFINGTARRPFYLNHDEKVEADFIQMNGKFWYYEDRKLEMKMLQLPFGKDKDFSLHLLLPKTATGLTALEKALFKGEIEFNKLFAYMNRSSYKEDLQVILPKFRITSDSKVDELCNKWESKPSRTQQTDVCQMTYDSDHAYLIRQILQKSVIEINEKGVLAASVTVLTGESEEERSGPGFYIADHPFIYLIHHHVTKTILFLGKINQADHLSTTTEQPSLAPVTTK